MSTGRNTTTRDQHRRTIRRTKPPYSGLALREGVQVAEVLDQLADRPTDWTKAHRAIDKALDRWQVAALES